MVQRNRRQSAHRRRLRCANRGPALSFPESSLNFTAIKIQKKSKIKNAISNHLFYEKHRNCHVLHKTQTQPARRSLGGYGTLRAPGASCATCNTGRPSCGAPRGVGVRHSKGAARARSDERRATTPNPREERRANAAADSQRARAPRGPSTCRVRYTDARRGATSEVRRTRGRDVRCTPTPHEPLLLNCGGENHPTARPTRARARATPS